ncbi:uncharacterized protein [Heterodontus francisci]|uniref:uncharacterized protein n=1 Tax=Heterodontus francisci TaxID=7792 RepID=UPI00355B139A
MAHFKGKSNWKQMSANTQMNHCSSPAHSYGKRNIKPSSKLKKLSFIHEEAGSELSSTYKLASGGHRSYLSRMKTTVQKSILKTKKGIEPFQNRSPSLQQWKEFTQSNSKNTTCFESTETSSVEFSLTFEVLPYLLHSLDSELLVDDSSSTGTDSCSSVELFREAEGSAHGCNLSLSCDAEHRVMTKCVEVKQPDHTLLEYEEDICWFHCKNSTLLDSSKAANIDVIDQPSNLSEITEQTGNVRREGSFNRDHVSDRDEVHGNSFTVAGKNVSKLQAGNEITLEQKRLHAISLPMEQKNPRLKQHEVPICSIILAPVCSRPSNVWQCEHVQSWTTFKKAPIDIIIDLPE